MSVRYIKLKPTFVFSIDEINLLTEALIHRASRHEAMGMRVRNGAAHARTAAAMRKLNARLRDEIWEKT
jgi:hypothetical protein